MILIHKKKFQGPRRNRAQNIFRRIQNPTKNEPFVVRRMLYDTVHISVTKVYDNISEFGFEWLI